LTVFRLIFLALFLTGRPLCFAQFTHQEIAERDSRKTASIAALCGRISNIEISSKSDAAAGR